MAPQVKPIITCTKGCSLSVQFTTVSIEIECSTAYEAQVLFDDLAGRLEAGEAIMLQQGRRE